MKKIEEKEIMTLMEAKLHERYKDKWFIFMYTEKIPVNPNEGKGCVAYTFDNENEMYKYDKTDIENVSCAYSKGISAWEGDEIGGVCYHE